MADAAMKGTRREGDREYPLGDRGRRTRDALLQGAWDEFSEKGYRATQVGDIAARAGASVGTFYQYFRGRSDVMSALVVLLVRGYISDQERSVQIGSGRDSLSSAIGGYLRGYQLTAAFQAAWSEATHTDPDLAAVRRTFAAWLIGGVESQLRRGQEAGEIRPELDPVVAARALTVMLDSYCYHTFVFDPPDPPTTIEESMKALVEIWSAALWVEPTPSRTPASG
jgi:AcrR family transcriptional regulator